MSTKPNTGCSFLDDLLDGAEETEDGFDMSGKNIIEIAKKKGLPIWCFKTSQFIYDYPVPQMAEE